MAEVDLTQDEADALIALPKIRGNHETTYYPDRGGILNHPVSLY